MRMYNDIKNGGIEKISTIPSARRNKMEKNQVTAVYPNVFYYEIEDITPYYKEEDGEWYPLPIPKFCRRCGRLLTDPISISRGIGPKCYEKEG